MELFQCYSIYSEFFMVVVEWILYLKNFGVEGLWLFLFIFLHVGYQISYTCWNSLL